MKKILSVLLTLAMLVSAVSMLSVSASAAEVSAPANIVAQKTIPTENKQDIRFVSEIDEAILTQDVNALGYTVKATFKNTNGDVKIVNYDESACEGTKVWTSYEAETTVERPTGKYFFILTITDVPTNIGDIFLEVTAYSRVGDQKNKGEAKQFCFKNGETSTTKLIYANGFDHLTAADYYNRAKNADATVNNLSALGFIGNTAKNWDAPSATAAIMKVSGESDKSLSVNGFGDIFDLLDADAFAGVSAFTIDVEMNITSLGNLVLMFDSDDSATKVQFRDYWFSPSNGNIWKQGNSESTSNANNNIFIKLTDTKTYNIRRYTTYPDTTNNQDRENAVKYGDTFTLSVNVVKATGEVTVSVNGTKVLEHTFGEITAPVLKLQNQNAPVTFDNIMIYSN